jgi:GTP cyclohydrolase IA
VPSMILEPTWQDELRRALALYLQQQVGKGIDISHIKDTPERIVRAFTADVSGYQVDPASFLTKKFAVGKYNEMVHVDSIRIVTKCAHHFERIIGKAHFAYIPGDYVVGLSKIPRMVDALCRRLQVQEDLTQQIVDIFQDTVQPKGCAVHIKAYHFCMMARGIREPQTATRTTALRGCFETESLTRQEFLQSLNTNGQVFP